MQGEHDVALCRAECGYEAYQWQVLIRQTHTAQQLKCASVSSANNVQSWECSDLWIPLVEQA